MTMGGYGGGAAIGWERGGVEAIKPPQMKLELMCNINANH